MKLVSRLAVLGGLFALLLSLSGCEGFSLFGPRLPAELQGSWSYSSSYYRQTFTFTATEISYSDYASNTGGSSSWEYEVIDVNAAENWFQADDDRYWIWHISGSKLYLDRLDRNVEPSSIASSWWSDTSYTKHYLSKD